MLLPTGSACETLGLLKMRNTPVIRLLVIAAIGLLLGFATPASTASAAPADGAHAAHKKHHRKHSTRSAGQHGKSKEPTPSPAPTGEL